jgi:recombinational DNA repair protein (RecF pathway)
MEGRDASGRLQLRALAERPVTVLSGVGPRKAEALEEMGITSVLDLITHYPRRYIDRTQQVAVKDLKVGEEAMVLAHVKRVSSRRTRQGRALVEIDVFDGTAYLRCTFFNQGWRAKQLVTGRQAIFFGKLDLFFVADFSFVRSSRSELHNLREVKVRDVHAFLRQEMAYLQQAAYCVRLVEQATETETPIAAIYELLLSFVDSLAGQACRPEMVLAFELKLLSELGLQPDLPQTKLSPGAKAVARNFEKADWAGVLRLRLHPAQQDELGSFLQLFLQSHLGHVPKGRNHALDCVKMAGPRNV